MNDIDTFQINYTYLLAGVVCVIESRLAALGNISNHIHCGQAGTCCVEINAGRT